VSNRLRFISAAILAVSIALMAVSFSTSSGGGRTYFGSYLGADHAGFYTAGWMLNHGMAGSLYDRDVQDRVHHQLHPDLDERETLPFLHPPFVAAAFQPFAELPYVWSFALWLPISLGLYLAGILVTLRSSALSPADRFTALLAALSFEPFVMECWQGGQLSVVAFFCIAVALALEQSGWRFASGLALGLCFYKPTFLALILPVLIVARRWRTLLGVAATGGILALVTLACVGWDGSMAFIDKLLGFSRDATGASPLALKTWKYVDLNAFTRLLLGSPGMAQKLLFLASALPALTLVLYRAWSLDRHDERYRRLVWAAVLIATPVVNLYVGIYDSVLAALGALLLVDALRREGAALTPAVRCWLGALYLTPWITQPVAKLVGVQLFTLVLLGVVVWICLFEIVGARTTREGSAP